MILSRSSVNSSKAVTSEKPAYYNTKSFKLDEQIQRVFDFNVEQEKKLRRQQFCSKSGKALQDKQLNLLKADLIDCCLTHMQDSYRVHINRIKGTFKQNLLQFFKLYIFRSPNFRLFNEL